LVKKMWDELLSEVQYVDVKLGGQRKQLEKVRDTIAANIAFLEAEIEAERKQIVEVDEAKKKARAALTQTRSPDNSNDAAEENCLQEYNALLKAAKELSPDRKRKRRPQGDLQNSTGESSVDNNVSEKLTAALKMFYDDMPHLRPDANDAQEVSEDEQQQDLIFKSIDLCLCEKCGKHDGADVSVPTFLCPFMILLCTLRSVIDGHGETKMSRMTVKMTYTL
jgi:DNA repair exonuclease SbcCD ATPase subunit